MSELLTLGRVRLGDVGRADEASPPAQPKRIALLVYLALATERGSVRRDLLLPLFWPELGQDEGRRALRQALHWLRRAISSDTLTADGDEIGVRPGALRCDAVELERLVESGQAEEALALYRGDFLDGFHVADASPEYEEWVDRTRARLRRRAAFAARAAAESAERDGRAARAMELARRGCELEPDEEAGWRRLMQLQERLGDRAGALRSYDQLAQRLEREYDAEPAAETTALATAIRASSPVAPVPRPEGSRDAAPDETLPAPDAAGRASDTMSPGRRRRGPVFAAVALVLLLALGIVAVRATGDDREEPSLMMVGSLAPSDRLLVADFASRGADTALAAAVTEAFRVDLGESPLVKVLTPRQVRTLLARMERVPDIAVDDSLAREVAAREGVKAFVTGSVARLGGAYVLTVELVSAASGAALTSVRETAADSSEIIAAVDRASERLRHRIGESLRELRKMPALAEVTTSSLAALRAYTAGRRLVEAGHRTDGIELLERAVALDSGFASAHLALGHAYGSISEQGRSDDALRRGLQFRDRLPFLERQFLVASHAYGTTRDYETAIDAYSQVLDRYPDQVGALNNLALVYRERRNYEMAESLFARAAAADSSISVIYFGLHSAQAFQGKFDASRATLDLIGRRFPGDPILMTVEVQDAAARQDWEAAERRAEATIAARDGDTLALVDAFQALAGIVMTRGRLTEAERYWRTQLALSAASESRGRHLFGALQLAWLELRHRKAPARAAAIVDSVLARVPLASLQPSERPYDELARFRVAVGDLTSARRLADSADANDRMLERSLAPERSWTRGVIALAEGRTAAAEHHLRLAAETHFCAMCPLPDLARAYEAAGRAPAAVTVLERYLATPWLWRYEIDAVELGWVMTRLAGLYEARGDAARSAEIRRRLLQLWRRADAELEPVLRQAQASL